MRGRSSTYALVSLAVVVGAGAAVLLSRQGPEHKAQFSAESVVPTSAPAPPPSSSPSASATPTPSRSASRAPSVAPRPHAPKKAKFPDAQTTGVPAGVSLRSYSSPCTVTKARSVIEARDVRCALVIKAADVVIRKSKVGGSVRVEGSGYSVRIEDSDIDGGSAQEPAVGLENVTVLRSDIRGGQASVNCYRNCVIQDSYLHDQYLPDGGDWHLNAFLSNGGSDIKLIGNTLACDQKTNSAGGGCTANASIFGDFGPNSGYTIQNNLFVASNEMSYCFYGGYDPGKDYGTQVKEIVVTGNVFERGRNGKCAGYGAVTSYDMKAPGSVWKDNTWDDGKQVPPDRG